MDELLNEIVPGEDLEVSWTLNHWMGNVQTRPWLRWSLSVITNNIITKQDESHVEFRKHVTFLEQSTSELTWRACKGNYVSVYVIASRLVEIAAHLCTHFSIKCVLTYQTLPATQNNRTTFFPAALRKTILPRTGSGRGVAQGAIRVRLVSGPVAVLHRHEEGRRAAGGSVQTPFAGQPRLHLLFGHRQCAAEKLSGRVALHEGLPAGGAE